jgi:N4-(beta-N-acetylglucosaminyl)-L-asparaginase
LFFVSKGETTLDAVIMDGRTHDAGAVAGLKRIRSAIKVAKAVMDYTKHTFLVGEAATQFAIDMGFQQQDLHAIESLNKWIDWFNNSCQPNFRMNVVPDPTKYCGPYKPVTDTARATMSNHGMNSHAMAKMTKSSNKRFNQHVSEHSHDTIGMVAIDSKGNLAAGSSTNGATHKIPGYFSSFLI